MKRLSLYGSILRDELNEDVMLVRALMNAVQEIGEAATRAGDDGNSVTSDARSVTGDARSVTGDGEPETALMACNR